MDTMASGVIARCPPTRPIRKDASMTNSTARWQLNAGIAPQVRDARIVRTLRQAAGDDETRAS
jgi:hypothetical protein